MIIVCGKNFFVNNWVKRNIFIFHDAVKIIKVHIFWDGHKILRNLLLTFDCVYCSKSKGKISQNFVVFSEYMNFKMKFQYQSYLIFLNYLFVCCHGVIICCCLLYCIYSASLLFIRNINGSLSKCQITSSRKVWGCHWPHVSWNFRIITSFP